MKAVTHALALQMFYPASYGDSVLEIKAHGPAIPHIVATDLAKTDTAKKLAVVIKSWKAKLPKKPEDLWAWVDRQQPATVQKLLAVCAAQTVNLVQHKEPGPTQAAVELAKAIKLDMADHFQASAANYFTRVPKKTLLAELGTAVSATTKRSLEGMKREQLGKTLTTELRGKKWLPPILRAGNPEVR
jgi:ParB family chromosome partitioning protein